MTEINVTPMVDVMLVLLVIFMVTAPLMVSGLDVELPRAEAPPMTSTEDQMVLGITRDGVYYINEHEFTIEELEVKLGAIVEANPDQDVFLRADGQVPYEQVAQLVSLCTRAGVARLGLVTQFGASE